MADKKITALTATTGVVAADVLPIVTDTTGTPTTKKITAANLAAYTSTGLATLASPTFTGTVGGVTASMVGLSSVNNTADTAKPVSTAQQTALDLKANLASPTFTGTVSGVTASMVGLGLATNTSDASKPVSTAQQTAFDLKANLVSPTFTGVPAAPTAAMSTSTTQVATTAYVMGAKEDDQFILSMAVFNS